MRIGKTGASRTIAKHFRPERTDRVLWGDPITTCNLDWGNNLLDEAPRDRVAGQRSISGLLTLAVVCVPLQTRFTSVLPAPLDAISRLRTHTVNCRYPDEERTGASMRPAAHVPHPLSVVPSIKTILRLRSATGLAYSVYLKHNHRL